MSMDWKMYQKIFEECKALGIEKNRVYGTESLKLFNGTAIVCRINDKIQRINNIYSLKQQDETFEESIDDTLMDLLNYTVYLIMLRRGGIQ